VVNAPLLAGEYLVDLQAEGFNPIAFLMRVEPGKEVVVRQRLATANAYIGRIAPRPLLMVNGVQDTDMIKDRAVEPLFRSPGNPSRSSGPTEGMDSGPTRTAAC